MHYFLLCPCRKTAKNAKLCKTDKSGRFGRTPKTDVRNIFGFTGTRSDKTELVHACHLSLLFVPPPWVFTSAISVCYFA
eukprot:396200-Amphidinium_carterae.1